MTPDESTYAFSNALVVQRERLRALESVLDAGTFRHLEERGVTAGWRCLEVGGGGGSVASWLVDRVGPDGSVLVTDLDTTLLDGLSHPNLEIRRHNIVEDELTAAEFDLIHLRLVLAWIGDRHHALGRMVAALKPGGWLVCEDMDFVSVVPDPRSGQQAGELFSRVAQAHYAVLAARNAFDPFYGRRLQRDVGDTGLVEVSAEGRASMWSGGGAGGTVWRLTLAQLREPMVATGLVTSDEIGHVMAYCDDPSFSFLSPVMVAAWGRRSHAP